MAKKKPSAIEKELATLRKEIAALKRSRVGEHPAKRVAADPGPEEPDWEEVEKKCPHCGRKKMVIPDFGLKPPDRHGRRFAQSWCRECRSQTNYHTRAPVYRTRNNPHG
jgi:hypothetical protein